MAACAPALALLGILAAPSGALAAPPSNPASKPSVPAAPVAPPKPIGAWWDRTDPGAGRKLPQSRYYSIRSDLPADQTRALSEHLDTMYEEYSRRLVQQAGLRRRSPEYLSVYIFAFQQDYLDTMRTQFGLNATGSGGMFFVSPRGAGLAFFVENLPKQRVAHVVQHEGFHQFAYAYFGNELPPWLNEGLAEFFGESVVEGRTVVIGQASPQVVTQVRTAIERDAHIPFLDILQMDDKRWADRVRSGGAALQYMQSWSMVHFLVYGDKGKYQGYFEALLKMVNAGSKPYDAMRAAFRFTSDADVVAFEKKWKEYAMAAKPGAFVAARGRLEFLAEGMLDSWGKGVRPKTLSDLRNAMREGKFTHTASTHGYTLVLSSSDDANFTIPDDAVNPKPAVIELAPAKTPKNGKLKKLEEQSPTPPTINTRGLGPKNLSIVWHRRAEDPAQFDYEIVVE